MADRAKNEELIYALAAQLTGANPLAPRPIIIHEVLRLAEEAGFTDLNCYLQMAQQDAKEQLRLLSRLTVHTTSWFREAEHFDFLRQHLLDDPAPNKEIHVLSAACSTGQEAYSLALLLDEIQGQGHLNGYRISGWDIDQLSIEQAQLGRYNVQELPEIPIEYHTLLQMHESGFELLSRMKARIRFHLVNLLQARTYLSASYAIIFCKNILIYFSPETALQVVKQLSTYLQPQGLLFLGRGESIELGTVPSLQRIAHAVYQKIEVDQINLMPQVNAQE